MKINEHGEYLPFAGVNLIALTRPVDAAIWQQLHDYLNSQPDIAEHFGLMPPEAYHMTLNPLYTQGQKSELKWMAFMAQNQRIFTELHQFINSEHFEFSSNIVVSTDNLLCEHALQLIIQISNTDHQNVLNIDKNIAIRKWFPTAFHMIKQWLQPAFHITLGYRYKTMTPETKAIIKDTVLTKVAMLFSDITLKLAPPSLCYFNNMTQFTPWDGSFNPFLSFAEPPRTTHLAQGESKSSSLHEYSLQTKPIQTPFSLTSMTQSHADSAMPEKKSPTRHPEAFFGPAPADYLKEQPDIVDMPKLIHNA